MVWSTINFEDLMLFAPWFRELLRHHCMFIDNEYRFRKPRMAFHARVSGHEVDIFIKCLGKNGKETSIILEMKDADLHKALEQALERRALADYVYVVINWSVAGILESLGGDWVRVVAEDAFRAGVGIVSGADGIIVAPARRYRKMNLADRMAGLIKYINGGDEDGG